MKSYRAQWDSFELFDGTLYRRWENPSGQQYQLQLLLPKSGEVLQQPKRRAFRSGYSRDFTCSVAEMMLRTSVDKAPLMKDQRLHTQCGSPFRKVCNGSYGTATQDIDRKDISIIMDYFIKRPEVYPMENQDTTTITDILVGRVFACDRVPPRASFRPQKEL